MSCSICVVDSKYSMAHQHDSPSARRPSLGERRLSRVRFSLSEEASASVPALLQVLQHGERRGSEVRPPVRPDYGRYAHTDISPHTASFPSPIPAAHLPRFDSSRPADQDRFVPRSTAPNDHERLQVYEACVDARRDSVATLADEETNRTVGPGEALYSKSKADPLDIASRPLKPALRRSQTEEARWDASQREASHLVHSHGGKGSSRGPPAISISHEQDEERAMDERMKGGGSGGILSNLLRLNSGSTGLHRTATSSSWASATSCAPSREGSKDSDNCGLRRRRRHSDVSIASQLKSYSFGDKSDGQDGTCPAMRRRSSSISVMPWSKKGGDDAEKPKTSKARRGRKKLRRLSVTRHVAGASRSISPIENYSLGLRHPPSAQVHPSPRKGAHDLWRAQSSNRVATQRHCRHPRCRRPLHPHSFDRHRVLWRP